MKDRRFTPLHNEGKDAWALKIQETKFSDSGQYECQVSYHNDVEKKLKKQVTLYVLGEIICYGFHNQLQFDLPANSSMLSSTSFYLINPHCKVSKIKDLSENKKVPTLHSPQLYTLIFQYSIE